MTKRKTKKKRFDPLFDFFRHPLSSFSHLTLLRLTIAFAGMLCLAGAVSAFEPAGEAQNSSGSHARVFVIFTTVLTDRVSLFRAPGREFAERIKRNIAGKARPTIRARWPSASRQTRSTN